MIGRSNSGCDLAANLNGMSLKVSEDGRKCYAGKEGGVARAAGRRWRISRTELSTQGDSHRDEEDRHGNPNRERIRQSFTA